MTLPPWAYAERQQQSPIVLNVKIISISCPGETYLLRARPLKVVRNHSNRVIDLNHNLIIFTPFKNDPDRHLSTDRAAPPLAGEWNPNEVPTVGTETLAWLRPQADQPDRFDLMANGWSSLLAGAALP
jgi:hypothetical protein